MPQVGSVERLLEYFPGCLVPERMLVPHGAVKPALCRLVAGGGEMDRAQFLIGIFLRDAWRRPQSKRCHACDGHCEQRCTHDLLPGQHAFALFCLIAMSVSSYGENINHSACLLWVVRFTSAIAASRPLYPQLAAVMLQR